MGPRSGTETGTAIPSLNGGTGAGEVSCITSTTQRGGRKKSKKGERGSGKPKLLLIGGAGPGKRVQWSRKITGDVQGGKGMERT